MSQNKEKIMRASFDSAECEENFLKLAEPKTVQHVDPKDADAYRRACKRGGTRSNRGMGKSPTSIRTAEDKLEQLVNAGFISAGSDER